MRSVLNPQLILGETDIGAVRISLKSRDDIPKLLLGLQHIYTHREIREAVFAILKTVVPNKVDGKGKARISLGRPGMEQWRILVLGSLRLCLNIDYDRLVELANYHVTIRQMMGHRGAIDELDSTEYTLQTVKDNLHLFTPQILGRINEVVVRAGHELVKKKDSRRYCEELNARVDSFVVETDVHYPTDVNLLWDAIRKVVLICGRASHERGWEGWRQYQHNVRTFKRQSRRISKLKRSNAQDGAKREARAAQIRQAHGEYIETAQGYLRRAQQTRAKLEKAVRDLVGAVEVTELDRFMRHAQRQIDQIRRRVLEGQSIPHQEKVFSIFEEHTEWISKGKAGVPVELGLKVAVVEDQYRFILNHRVLRKTEDVEAAVPLIKETQQKYGTLVSASFDTGFHSPANQTALDKLVQRVVLPKKGKLSAQEMERESEPQFVRLRKQHASVESAINALECHGLDRCLDHGVRGFERYVALAVLARNVLRLGQILHRHAARHKPRAYRQAA
ncbi:MAG: ISNCY family transposase [Gammaproteobacteria bacterium]|nr:ISNCY family transposase [Gammaproteobacteria bacterium]